MDEFLGLVAGAGVIGVILVVLYLALGRGGGARIGDQPFPWIVVVSALAAVGYILYIVYEYFF